MSLRSGLWSAVMGAAFSSWFVGSSDAHAAIDPPTRTFLAELAAAGGPPIYTLSPRAARDVLNDLQRDAGELRPADVVDETIPAGPTGRVAVRIVRPKGLGGSLPIVMWFHGGGWVLGNKMTHDRLIREIAHQTQAAVVFVDYDKAPEAQYPVQNEQAYAATKYVVDNAAALGFDGTRLALAGESVGGNMVAAVSLMARERGDFAPRAQVLLYPVTDAAFDSASYREFADGP